MKKNRATYQNKRRIIFVFALTGLLFFLLTLRLGWHVIIMGDTYAKMALKQQISDNIVTATRGNIVDSNGNSLAISATTHTVWVRPKTAQENGKTDAAKAANLKAEIDKLSEILGMDTDAVSEVLNSSRNLVKLAKNVDEDTADALRNAKLVGLEIVEDAKRYYPLGAFASQIIGITTDDNVGLTGLETYYEQYLSGRNGRWITTKDNKNNSLVFGTSKYYDASDGCTVVTTIDQTIQYVVEEKIAKFKEKTGAERVMAIVMDPRDGAVLGMAQTEEYDLNNPREPRPEDAAAFSKMTDAQKVAYWNKLWRNFCICDVYEPGSTFKLLTVASALDAGVTHLGDKFVCSGKVTVADRIIRCWYYPKKHGNETLEEALENSCNPAMIELAQRMGVKSFYEGLDAFGLTDKTGIDYPGEAGNIIHSQKSCGPVDLACMSFGQGIALTPISLVSAVSAIGNEGKLMQPHLVKQIIDSDGNVVMDFKPTVKSIAISEQTAANVLSIMESQVNNGSGGKAKIEGYRIAGKTGTAQKPNSEGTYTQNDVYASFISIAPVDDPQFVVLVIVDHPNESQIHGSATAAPCVKEILQELFLYRNIQPKYTEAQLKKIRSTKTTVPDVSGISLETAIGKLGGQDLGYTLSPATNEDLMSIIVTDQWPKPGTEADKNSEVTLYYEIVKEDAVLED